MRTEDGILMGIWLGTGHDSPTEIAMGCAMLHAQDEERARQASEDSWEYDDFWDDDWDDD